jgi:phosphoribosylaminoimidazolecarboxamide formyltransferase/IMP cyclohydrolase
VFLEVIVAPDFEAEALELLKAKKNLRLIKLNTPLKACKTLAGKEVRITPFGVLVQDSDRKELDKDTFQVVTKQKPTAEMVEDMVFAWKVAKHVKSNAIVVAKDFKTLGISGGQTSRIEAMEIALNKACDGTKDAVVASDGFFPAIDNIQAAAQCRIAAIIQPGGSIKDNDVTAEADKHGLIMINTGVRHFKH